MATRARILADYVSGGTTAAEFDYMDGVTSNVQTQMDAKLATATATSTYAPKASPTFTGTTTVSGDLVPSTPLSNRNMIINGGMTVWQRATGVTTVSSGYSTVDRWAVYESSGATTTTEKYDLDDTNGEVMLRETGHSTALLMKCTVADTSVAAADYIFLKTTLEGQDLQHLQYGTANAKTITLSFWVKSSKTGTHVVTINKQDNTRYMLPLEYTISSADTWEQKKIVITPTMGSTSLITTTTAGEIANTNGGGVAVSFSLMTGTTHEGTANTWQASSTAWGTSGGVNWANETNDFYLTGVQLELGSNATPFEHRSYGDELHRCQRYYQRYGSPKTFEAGTHFHNSMILAWCLPQDSDDVAASHILPVEMRTTPTASITEAHIRLNNNATNQTSGNTLQAQHCSSTHAHLHIDLDGSVGTVNVNNMIALSFSSTAGYYDLSAEL